METPNVAASFEGRKNNFLKMVDPIPKKVYDSSQYNLFIKKIDEENEEQFLYSQRFGGAEIPEIYIA